MARLLFDLEADNLLADVTKIHCGVTRDLDTGDVREYGPTAGDLAELLAELEQAEVLCGFNIGGYDIPMIRKLHGWNPVRGQKYLDLKAMSRAMYPGPNMLRSLDFVFQRKRGADAIPNEMCGWHSLAAWSFRLQLGVDGKGEYDGGWEKWNADMQEYCVQDVGASFEVLQHFRGARPCHPIYRPVYAQGWSAEAVHVESRMTELVTYQEQNGIGFDVDAGIAMLAELTQEQADMARELAELFPPVYKREGKAGTTHTPKRSTTSKKHSPGCEGYVNTRAGCAYSKIKMQDFNPGSRMQVGKRLVREYGWEPQDFTPSGEIQVSDEILRDLPFAPAKRMADYLENVKVLGYLSEGAGAWLKKVGSDGVIHARVNPTGAVSHRANHVDPNLAQVPSSKRAIGMRCRALFTPPRKGWVLVGADASALQLAIYAHFVGRFDGGKLAAVIEDPEQDAHEYMRAASGLFLRDYQKTLTYATWFGAQEYKQGTICLDDWREARERGLTDKPLPPLSQARKLGAKLQYRMRTQMAGYEDMQGALEISGKRGWLKGLDGRRIPVLDARRALVSLLQGNEAIIMKHAYVDAFDTLCDTFGFQKDWGFCLWVHDEDQVGTRPAMADEVGKILCDSIVNAGERLGLRLRLSAEYKVGATWAETH